MPRLLKNKISQIQRLFEYDAAPLSSSANINLGLSFMSSNLTENIYIILTTS